MSIDTSPYEDPEWILDPAFAHRVWSRIASSARLYWPDDQKLLYVLNEGGLSGGKKYERSGSWDDEDPRMWIHRRGGVAGLPFNESPNLLFMDDKVRKVGLAGTPYTVLGSWFTWDMKEDASGSVAFDPVRVPVPEGMEAEVVSWAEGYGGEMYRMKKTQLRERFAVGDDDALDDRGLNPLNDYHVRIENVEESEKVWRIFEEAAEFAERAVRKIQ